jgi:hypothetical protein
VDARVMTVDPASKTDPIHSAGHLDICKSASNRDPTEFYSNLLIGLENWLNRRGPNRRRSGPRLSGKFTSRLSLDPAYGWGPAWMPKHNDAKCYTFRPRPLLVVSNSVGVMVSGTVSVADASSARRREQHIHHHRANPELPRHLYAERRAADHSANIGSRPSLVAAPCA